MPAAGLPLNFAGLLPEASWIFWTTLITAFATGFWRLSIWGALRKTEKEILPKVEKVRADLTDKITESEDRTEKRINNLEEHSSASVKELNDKRERLERELETRLDSMREHSLNLHHSLEIDNAKLRQQMEGLQSYSNQIMGRIDEVERRMEDRVGRSEKAILQKLEDDQKHFHAGLSELKKEIRSWRNQ